jgi:hypothetical protein
MAVTFRGALEPFNEESAAAWTRLTGDPVPGPSPGGEAVGVALSVSDRDFNGSVTQIIEAGKNVHAIASTEDAIRFRPWLIAAGFREVLVPGGSVFELADVAARCDEPITAALDGPVAARLYAGVTGTKSATAADLGVRRRPILSDRLSPSSWLAALTGETEPKKRVLRIRQPQLVAPLESDDRRPVVIDGAAPKPVIGMGDCDLHLLQRRVSDQADEVATFRGSGPLHDPVATIRSARLEALSVAARSSGIVLIADTFRCELDRASIIVDAVSKGVPVLVDRPDRLNGYLGGRLLAELTHTDPTRFHSVLYRDVVAVRQGRALAKEVGSYPLPIDPGFEFPRPSVSVLLASIRPQIIPQALSYVSKQTYENFEVVILAHGEWASPDLAAEWSRALELEIRVINVDADLPLGHAYNVGIREAAGDVITKWDDDDHYGPDHLWDLVIAQRSSHADLVGKAAEFVYIQELDMTIQRSSGGRFSDTTFLAGGTLALHRSAAIEVGGFPTLTHFVDQGLIERIKLGGGRTYRTHGYAYMLHRAGHGHTWTSDDGYFLGSSIRHWRGMERQASDIDEEVER